MTEQREQKKYDPTKIAKAIRREEGYIVATDINFVADLAIDELAERLKTTPHEVLARNYSGELTREQAQGRSARLNYSLRRLVSKPE
jgi:hypothetical protein